MYQSVQNAPNLGRKIVDTRHSRVADVFEANRDVKVCLYLAKRPIRDIQIVQKFPRATAAMPFRDIRGH